MAETLHFLGMLRDARRKESTVPRHGEQPRGKTNCARHTSCRSNLRKKNAVMPPHRKRIERY